MGCETLRQEIVLGLGRIPLDDLPREDPVKMDVEEGIAGLTLRLTPLPVGSELRVAGENLQNPAFFGGNGAATLLRGGPEAADRFASGAGHLFCRPGAGSSVGSFLRVR